MGPTWVLSAPDGPHVGPMNFTIRDIIYSLNYAMSTCDYHSCHKNQRHEDWQAVNSFSLYIFYQWPKRPNVSENIVVDFLSNTTILGQWYITRMENLLTFLFCQISILFYCQRIVKIPLSCGPLHSRVNSLHFKGGHLVNCEMNMMKSTWVNRGLLIGIRRPRDANIEIIDTTINWKKTIKHTLAPQILI